jgi:hypothetical protein
MGKILANAFIHDFNQEKFDWQFDEKRISDLLTSLSKRRLTSRSPGVTEDDVVSFGITSSAMLRKRKAVLP